MMAMQFDNSTFEAEVLDSDLPVLVDFYTDWCGPCKMMAPVLEELAAKYHGRVVIGKVNAEESLQLAQQYGIVSVPTLILFHRGRPAGQLIGFHRRSEVEELISSVL
ncbi:MAG: thioredoxin [Clostridiales bacterium]|nr:thioredoxin [Clostridiales bacterium]